MKKFVLKIITLTFLLLTFCVSVTAQGTGYVTIQGKQFKLNGNNYYPMVMNYSIESVVHNSTYFISPDHSFNTSNDFECTNLSSCNGQIQNDFNYIAGMGFNAVRLAIYPKYYPGTGFYLRFKCLDQSVCDSIIINPDDPYDPGLHILLSYYDDILARANATVNSVTSQNAPLKIIFILLGYHSDLNTTELSAWNDLFEAISAHIATASNNDALFAYDLINEPCYSVSPMKTKEDACNMINTWYSTINANDPDHLVTIGSCGYEDVTSFDPAILKLDFLSLHFYPDFQEYENRSLPSVQQTAITRSLNKVYWTQQNSALPFIIGETGFTASINYPDYATQIIPLGFNGSITDQATYALQTLNATCNCGSSGYSWWSYQDVSYSDPGPSFGGNFFGLLERNHAPESSAEKQPTVNNFRNYTPGITGSCPVDYSSTYNINKLYYNPYQHPSNPTKTITGTITDQNSTPIPIKDAYLLAWTDLGWTFDPTPPNPQFIWHSDLHYTFSDNNGYFEVIPYANILYPAIDIYPAGTGNIVNITMSAAGAERINYGWCCNNITSNISCTLNKVNYDVSINNHTVSNGTSENFQAKNTLTTSNIVIQSGATAEFKATNEIHLLPGFDAESGSDVHIYCTPVFLDCSNYSSFQMQRQANPYVTQSVETEITKEIEVNFKKINIENSLSVFPNPNSGIFTVELTGGDTIEKIHSITILDMMNRIIETHAINEKTYKLDLSSQPKGIYIIKVNDSSKTYNQKIIIH